MLLIGPRLQWCATLITDASLENALLQWAWSRSSSPECRREYLTRIPRAARTLVLPNICLFRDRHAHTNPHCHASAQNTSAHACNKETMMMMIFFFFFSPVSIHVLIKSPQLQSQINLFLRRRGLLKQSLQDGFARYCLTPRLFAFSLPFYLFRVVVFFLSFF